ncbi:MAG: hypothetical protein ACHP9T_12030 [Caulobacterales bacterium]|jgi:hypothetical protein
MAVTACALVAGQASAAGYRAPRTANGAPDLQGIWTNLSLTRLERPAGIKDLILKDAEAPAVERRIIDKVAHPTDDEVGGHDSEWWDGASLARIDGHARTSWIVSPADGKLPYTVEAQQRVSAKRAAVINAFDGPEDRTLSERCLIASWGAAGPPILNSPYSANYQIVQTPDHVVILSELNDDVRIVRLNARRPPATMRFLTGDSIGHWEKDTLVVETAGFQPGESYRTLPYLSSEARVIERFTRVSPTEIRYEFSVEDPKIFKQVWRAEMPFLASKGPIYESACHEGNYSMASILAGARQAEARAKPAP